MAAVNGQTEVVREMIATGVDVNAANWPLQPALISAAQGGHKEIVTLLLDHGANIDVQLESNGATPLIVAASTDQTELVSLLLARGADVSLKTKPNDLGPGVDAMAVARVRKKKEIIEMLEKAQVAR